MTLVWVGLGRMQMQLGLLMTGIEQLTSVSVAQLFLGSGSFLGYACAAERSGEQGE
jgi:hypothetical protein